MSMVLLLSAATPAGRTDPQTAETLHDRHSMQLSRHARDLGLCQEAGRTGCRSTVFSFSGATFRGSLR